MTERENGDRRVTMEKCRRLVDESVSASPITPEGISGIDYALASAFTKAALGNGRFIRAVLAHGKTPAEVLSIDEGGVSDLSPRGILDMAEAMTGDPNTRARIIKGVRAFVPRDSKPDTISLRRALTGLVDDERAKQKEDANRARMRAVPDSKRPDSSVNTTVVPEIEAEFTSQEEALLAAAILERLNGDRVFEQQNSMRRGALSRHLRDLSKLGALRACLWEVFDPLRNKRASRGDWNHIGRRLYGLVLGTSDSLSAEQSVLREKYVIWLGATFGVGRVSRWKREERESLAGLASEN